MFSRPSAFGSGTFGAASTSTGFGSTGGGLFGSTANQPAASGSNSLFGNRSTTVTGGGGGLFGSTTQTSGFGSANTGSNLFGSTTASKPSAFSFGASNTNTSGGLFGSSTQNQPQSGGLFGSTAPSSGGLFGSSSAKLGPSTSSGTLFGSTNTQAAKGTTIPFVPQTSSDRAVRNKQDISVTTKQQCICFMKEYENQCPEELRILDYVAGRKGPQPGSTFGAQPQQASGGLFGSSQPSTGFGGFGSTNTGGSSLFGGGTATVSQPSAFGSSLFGSTTATTSASGGLFGSTPAAAGATGGGLFGSSTQTTSAPSLFNFGASSAAKPAFSFSPSTTTTATVSPFAAKPAGTASPFSLSAAPTATASPFSFNTGANAAKPTLGGFGTTQPATGGFGGFGATAAPAQPVLNLGQTAAAPSAAGATISSDAMTNLMNMEMLAQKRAIDMMKAITAYSTHGNTQRSEPESKSLTLEDVVKRRPSANGSPMLGIPSLHSPQAPKFSFVPKDKGLSFKQESSSPSTACLFQDSKLDTPSSANVSMVFTPRKSAKSLIIKKADSSFNASLNTTCVSPAVGASKIVVGGSSGNIDERQSPAAAVSKLYPKVVIASSPPSNQTNASMSAAVDKSAIKSEFACGATLIAMDYSTMPPLETVNPPDHSGKCLVKEFTVKRQGFGEICWPGLTDIARLPIDNIVRIGRGEIMVYPPETSLIEKPEVGVGLNKSAIVTLEGIYPKDKCTNQLIEDVERIGRMKYGEYLARKTDSWGATFVSYTAEGGVWKFKVPHF